METEERVALEVIRDRLEEWIKMGEELVQIINSILPTRPFRPMTHQQMLKELDKIVEEKRLSG